MMPTRPTRLESALLLPATLFVLAVSCLAGCANKPGTALAVGETETPVNFADPSSTNSSHVIGAKTTTVTGPLGSETARFTDQELIETNAGSALKQRGVFAVGRLRGLLSGASDLDIAGVEIAFGPEGDASTLKIARIGTNNSAVQRAANEGLVALVAQWQRSSDNERAVLEAQLAAQAKIGDAVAATAQAVIAVLKTASVP